MPAYGFSCEFLALGPGAKRLNSERGVRGAAAPRWLKEIVIFVNCRKVTRDQGPLKNCTRRGGYPLYRGRFGTIQPFLRGPIGGFKETPVQTFPPLPGTIPDRCNFPTPISKMSSSQSCSRRNSVQNRPIESSTALTGPHS